MNGVWHNSTSPSYVFAAVKRCHEVLHEMRAPRIHTTMRVGTRTDRTQSLEDKVRSVSEKLA